MSFIQMTPELLEATLGSLHAEESAVVEEPKIIEGEESVRESAEEEEVIVEDAGESKPEAEENAEGEEDAKQKESDGEKSAEEDTEEADVPNAKPKLKSILKREQKLLEEKRSIEAEKAKIEAEKVKLEESLKKYDMAEIEKIQNVAKLLKEGKGKKELFDIVGVSPKEFLKKSFEFNPAFVRETFKEYLEGKEFNPEDDEISKERKVLEAERKAIEEEKAEKKLNSTKETLYNTVDFSKSSILSAIPKDEIQDAIYDTTIALLQRRPELKAKSIKEVVNMVAPAVEQVYKKKYEKLAEALSSASKASSDKGSSGSGAKAKSTPAKEKSNAKSLSGKGVGGNSNSSNASSGVKPSIYEEIAKLPPRERASALMKAGLL